MLIITVNYREAYDMFAVNGILFNHESPVRGETFVTRKITRAVAAIEKGLQSRIFLGNIDAKRDWGHARDYVEGMWRMLQHDVAEDFVLATGETHSVREFVELAFAEIGRTIKWRGEGVEEEGYCANTGDILVKIDPRYFRPTEVDLLLGDPTKAKKKLGWKHKISLEEMCKEMVESDLKDYEEQAHLKKRKLAGYTPSKEKSAGATKMNGAVNGTKRRKGRSLTEKLDPTLQPQLTKISQ